MMKLRQILMQREEKRKKTTLALLLLSLLSLSSTLSTLSLSSRALQRFYSKGHGALRLGASWCLLPPASARNLLCVSALFWEGKREREASLSRSPIFDARSPPPPPPQQVAHFFLLHLTLKTTNHQQYSGRYVDLLAQASRMR